MIAAFELVCLGYSRIWTSRFFSEDYDRLLL